MDRILSVLHECNTGWHTFTSVQLPGLFLTGKDENLPELKEALPSTITALIEAEGVAGLSVWPAPSFNSKHTNVERHEMLHFFASSSDM